MRFILLFLLFPITIMAQEPDKEELSRWQKRSLEVTIIRDQWGIPHVYGKTDADCVFGLMYAQAEDDFTRIEMNYVEKLGRMAEIKGESAVYNDLLNRLVLDSAGAIEDFSKSPSWLKALLIGFADGMNYFLYKHPATRPAIIHHFEPWYPLLWTDGSIGAISTAGITTAELKQFFSGMADPVSIAPVEALLPTGSNGFAIAPAKSATGHALLYINPHVGFYFRPEVHVVSEEGLNAYGAVTWGQFFVYQGFNEYCGWMHTSSEVDVADLYIEKLSQRNNQWFYEYENKSLPVKTKSIQIRWRNGDELKTKSFQVMFTRHGPIMTRRNGEWISMKANNRMLTGLEQSWLRTKTKSFAEFKKVLELRSNPSNNTVYADAEGNIAYWHGNFIPVRDKNFDWAKPVDGRTEATEWKRLHTIDETVHMYNPVNGWLQNCNSTPFTVAGTNSPKRENYPKYMAPDGENFRGIDAVRLLGRESAFTLDKLISAGYDNYLAAFEVLVPGLIKGWERTTQSGDTSYKNLEAPIAMLKKWDFRCSETSIPTTLAIEWGQKLLPAISKYNEAAANDQPLATRLFIEKASPDDLLKPLRSVILHLTETFGTWQIPLGEINRYQRLNGHVDPEFDDRARSEGVGKVSSIWGCLPAFSSSYIPGNKLRYGMFGNSFVCAVEFGKRIKAKSLLTGGESGHPDSRHFSDQARMYVEGQFKDVLFYKEDILAHAEKSYHP